MAPNHGRLLGYVAHAACGHAANRLVGRQCSAASFSNAEWPASAAGSVAAGVCDTGYAGSPSCECDLNGSWGEVSNPCLRALRVLKL